MTWPNCSSARLETIRPPAERNDASGKPDRNPASDSTSTSKPAFFSLRRSLGTERNAPFARGHLFGNADGQRLSSAGMRFRQCGFGSRSSPFIADRPLGQFAPRVSGCDRPGRQAATEAAPQKTGDRTGVDHAVGEIDQAAEARHAARRRLSCRGRV